MKVKSIGWGQMTATNGVDTLQARYQRGARGEDGEFHAHWHISDGKMLEGNVQGREAVLRFFESALVKPNPCPLSPDTVATMYRLYDHVFGIVEMPLATLMSLSSEDCVQLMMAKLSSVPLKDVQYRVVGFDDEDGESLYIRVSGIMDSRKERG